MEALRSVELTGTNRSFGLIEPTFMHGDDNVVCTKALRLGSRDPYETTMSRKQRADRAELVAMPGVPHPIPSRTRSLSPPGSMVLRLKAWESRSLPALHGSCACLQPSFACLAPYELVVPPLLAGPIVLVRSLMFDAGWSSPVARQAHNLKVVGSNPAPAPK